MTEGCPHCVTLAGSCCLCAGTRRIDSELLTPWLWAYTGCDCQACRVLLTIRADTRPRPEIGVLPYEQCRDCGVPHLLDPITGHRCQSCYTRARTDIQRRHRENKRCSQLAC